MKNYVRAAIGLVVGIVMLAILFRGTSWNEFRTSILAADPLWLAGALVPLVASFFFRILRWGYIVRAVHPHTSFRNLFSATQIGFLANFLLPARIGELVRAVVLARLTRLPATQSLALVALDRVNDLIGLLTMIAVALISFRPHPVEIPASVLGTQDNILIRPEYLNRAEAAAALFFVLMCAGLAALYISRTFVLRVSDAVFGVISQKLAERIHKLLDHFAQGLHVFRSPMDMAKSVAFNLVTWGCFVLFSAALCEAFRLDWPWYAPFVMQIGVAVFISVPGAPGFIGQFQLGVVASLLMTIPNLNLGDALALAIVSHVANFVCVAILGVFSLYREGLNLFELSRQTEKMQ